MLPIPTDVCGMVCQSIHLSVCVARAHAEQKPPFGVVTPLDRGSIALGGDPYRTIFTCTT